MQSMQTFARDADLPSWFVNALGKFLSVAAPQFSLVQVDATHVEVPASADAGAAVVAIAGLWRWVEATVGPVAHPGGAAGAYPIFVTAKNNSIANVPLPFTDNTDYSFALQIRAPGSTPPIVAGVVDVYRQVGVAQWDGTRITSVQQTVPLGQVQDTGWLALTGFPAGVAADVGFTPSARLRDDEVRLKGQLLNQSGATIPGGTAIANIPAMCRPDRRIPLLLAAWGGAGGAQPFAVDTNGNISLYGGWDNGIPFSFNGVTYSLS